MFFFILFDDSLSGAELSISGGFTFRFSTKTANQNFYKKICGTTIHRIELNNKYLDPGFKQYSA